MNDGTPRLRAHLLAELRDLEGGAATTEQLAKQVPFPHVAYGNDGSTERGAWGAYVYPHLRALEAKGLVRRVARPDQRSVAWALVEGTSGRVRVEATRR